MMIHEITQKAGRSKDRKRVGRGHGSGSGKTSGRGHKGAGQRAGNKSRPYFEGGQMSWVRRIPKRGFTNHDFRTVYHVVNVKTLEAFCDDGSEVTAASLAAAGVIRDDKLPLKILGEGDVTKKFNVTAAKYTASAREKIEKAGGTATEDAPKKWTRAGARAAGKSK